MRKWVVFLILCLSLGASLGGKGIRYGMSQAEVEAVLGKPAAALTKGTRLVLLYPKNVRIELERGVAVSIANVPVDIADSLTQAVIGGAIYALWKTDHLFHFDLAVSYFVLLGVLMKTTHACTLQRAVAVAGAAKLASIVMWALVSMMILNLLT